VNTLLQTIARYSSNMLVSLLPVRYRSRLEQGAREDLVRAAALAGVLQGVLCLGLLASGFLDFAKAVSEGRILNPEIAEGVINQLGGEGKGHLPMFGLGPQFAVTFLLEPRNAVLIYFWLEGFLKAIAAYSSGQVLGTLPLYLVSVGHNAIDYIRYRWWLGPLVHDEILPGDGKSCDMKVLSCRPKLDWSRYVTIKFREEFYQMIQQDIGGRPRPFTYLLRRNPTGRLVVVVLEYGSEAILKKRP
jgi:hypothetical protein